MVKEIETKQYPTEVIASLSSGVLFCDFSAVHEAAEFLMGHPIWTHHFADKDLCREMQATILEQCPGMPTEFPGVTKENYIARIAALKEEIGETCLIRKGGGLTAMLPTDGIPDHLKDKTVFVSTDAPN